MDNANDIGTELKTALEVSGGANGRWRRRAAAAWGRLRLWHKLAAAAAVLALMGWLVKPGGGSNLPMAPVQQGEFVIDLHETGTIRAENSIIISAPQVRLNLQIINLVAEGAMVDAGDFLIQFDTTEIKQNIDDRQSDLDLALANYERSLASIASERAGLEAQIENARAAVRMAELRLEQLKFEAEARQEEGRLNLQQAQINLQQAMQRLEAQKAIDSAEVRSLELKIHQARLELEKARSDKERLTVRAPGPGLVVYQETWRSGEMAKIKVGDTPWRGMALMELPDLTRMMMETYVNEVDVAKVKVGQEVEVRLDAYPEPVFRGEVAEVGILATRREGVSDAKVFEVKVRLKDSDPLLRPGMSATARVIIERIPNQKWVPIEAVFQRDGRQVVYAAAGMGWKERVVKLGRRNDNFVTVEGEVEAGDMVAMVDPTLEPSSGEGAGKQGSKGGVSAKEESSAGGATSPGPPRPPWRQGRPPGTFRMRD